MRLLGRNRKKIGNKWKNKWDKKKNERHRGKNNLMKKRKKSSKNSRKSRERNSPRGYKEKLRTEREEMLTLIRVRWHKPIWLTTDEDTNKMKYMKVVKTSGMNHLKKIRKKVTPNKLHHKINLLNNHLWKKVHLKKETYLWVLMMHLSIKIFTSDFRIRSLTG